MGLDSLDLKVLKIYPEYVIKKSLVRNLKIGYNVPTYVLEHLLGTYADLSDPRDIKGVDTVEVRFGTHAFASYDVTEGEWTTVGRTYQVRAGSSSRDIRAQQPVTVSGSRPAALARGGSYRTGRVHGASAAEFESLLGSPLPSPDWPKGAALTRDSIIEQARWHGPLGALLALGLDGAKAILSAAGKPLEAQYVDFANALPFRSLERMSGGVVTPAMLDGILAAFNGRILAGLSHTANAARTKESR